MDASTSATIAALVVAILAMVVALLQAAQQYIVTGQLIRLCDSVVFGKMPGQGRRVWQLSQFRFRIVYWVPQVSLRKDLWPSTLPHIPSYAKGAESLPDLGFLSLTKGQEEGHLATPSVDTMDKRTVSSMSAGEASWVSFCRAVQLSSGRSMVLDLIQGDADRCPPDLPNVPMQMSMRDVATLGLMTGLKCTAASFDAKSLSMQGLPGTITTSQHPVLGPILHFSPRNMTIEEAKELQIGTGAVNPLWMARMWDEVIVAGHRYNRKERAQVEIEESFWADRPREKALVPATRNHSPPPESLYGLRRRVSATSLGKARPDTNNIMTMNTSTVGFSGSTSVCREGRTLWTRSDGDWYLDNDRSQDPPQSSSFRKSSPVAKHQYQSQIANIEVKSKWRRWAKLLQFFRNKGGSDIPEKQEDPFGTEIECGYLNAESMKDYQTPLSTGTPIRHPLDDDTNQRRTKHDRGVELQPRWLIRDYIHQKRIDLTRIESIENFSGRKPRLIEWYNEEDLEIPELNGTERMIASAVLEAWTASTYDSNDYKSLFYARKWRSLVQQRQSKREKRSRSRPRSRPRSASRSTNRSAIESAIRSIERNSVSRSRSRYRSDDFVGNESFGLRPRVYHVPDTNYMQHRNGTSSRSRSRRPSYNYPSTSFRASEDFQVPRRRRSSSPPYPNFERQSRSRSHVRSRPSSTKDVEYGDAVVSHGAERDESATAGPSSGSPVSPDHYDSSLPSRVNFDHAVQVFVPSSEDEDEDTDPELVTVLPAVSPATPGDDRSTRPVYGISTAPSKGILKQPSEKFAEEPNPFREGVAPAKDAHLEGVPSGARWTKIDRKLISPRALEIGKERFEETPTSVIVLRVLSKAEIQRYALFTHQMRLDDGGEDSQLEHDSATSDQPEEERGRRRRRPGSPTSITYQTSSGDYSLNTNWAESMDSVAPNQLGYDADKSIPSPRSPLSPPRRYSPFLQSRIRSRRNVASQGGSVPNSRSRSRAPSEHSHIYFQFDQGSSDSYISEMEIEEPRSVSGASGGPRAYSHFDEVDVEELDDDSLESMNGFSSITSKSIGDINWFWACQMDVLPGYVATPWAQRFSTQICMGAITVAIEAIGLLTHHQQPVYLDLPSHPRGLDWMSSGLSTFPPYGISANHHHGTVISGAYSTRYFPGFRAPLFQIELLRHYGYQVDRGQHSDAANLRARLTELMALDSWLSYCGRQPEICGRRLSQDTIVPAAGSGDLLYNMPTIVERTVRSFTFEFANLERSSIDGGHQIVQQIAGNLLDTLGWKVEGLTPAEKLFSLVALLRTSKMALCIAQGTDTSALRDILLNDVQVHLI